MIHRFLTYLIYQFKIPRLVISTLINKLQMGWLWFYKKEAITNIKHVYQTIPISIQPIEAYILQNLVWMQSHLDGEIAEVGVFRGGTAQIICQNKGLRTLFLFDTFDGLPLPGEEDKVWGHNFFTKRSYRGNLEEVKRSLSKYPNIQFIPGIFPKTAHLIEDKLFSFVHLDMDLYEGTLSALGFFWERLIPRGIILLHDYHTAGIKKAVTEFIAVERPLYWEMPGTQLVIFHP